MMISYHDIIGCDSMTERTQGIKKSYSKFHHLLQPQRQHSHIIRLYEHVSTIVTSLILYMFHSESVISFKVMANFSETNYEYLYKVKHAAPKTNGESLTKNLLP